MESDRSEDEPDEYDPEAEFRDPDSDSITIPKVSTEDAGSDLRNDLRSEFEDDAVAPEFSSADTDVSSDLLTEFWALVLIINVAVLAYALGLLFLIFEGETTYAAYLVGAGLALTGFAVRRYRSVERSEYSSSTDDAGAETDANDTGTETDGDTAEPAANGGAEVDGNGDGDRDRDSS